MNDADVLEILHQTQAIRTGHFKLTSGLHSDTYIQCARLLEHPRLTNQLAREVVSRLPKGLEIDLVASPAVGGILFGFAVAAALDVDLVFSERVDGRMEFRRSFEIPAGSKVLIAEDVVTTGGSVQEVIELVEAAGGELVGVVSLISRGDTHTFTADYYPLLQIDTPSWKPEDCYLCARGENISSPGSRNLAK
jgi:orotate phosphoribosyltransferase